MFKVSLSDSGTKSVNVTKSYPFTVSYCSRGEIWQNQECKKCPVNYYSLNDPINPASECEPCPKNAICNGGDSLIPLS